MSSRIRGKSPLRKRKNLDNKWYQEVDKEYFVDWSQMKVQEIDIGEMFAYFRYML